MPIVCSLCTLGCFFGASFMLIYVFQKRKKKEKKKEPFLKLLSTKIIVSL